MMDLNISLVSLPYKNALPVGTKFLAQNDFLKVSFFGDDYYLSVLPGLHDSTLNELKNVIYRFFSLNQLNFENIDLEKRFFNMVFQDIFNNSINAEVLFNIETLLLGLLIKKKLVQIKREQLQFNQLYSPDSPIENYSQTKCLKIKLRPHNTKETIELLRSLHDHNPKLLFRLDGNRQFEITQLLDFSKELEQSLEETALKSIDYLEEPLKNFYDSFVFKKYSSLNLAIDESFRFYGNSMNFDMPAVIKPSLFGISPLIHLLRSRQDLRAIISSTYEHPSVLHGLYLLAYERPSEFHGVDLYFDIH